MPRHRLSRAVAGSLLAGLLASGSGIAMAPESTATPQYGAAMNYRLHCEGCHKDDGSGQPGFVPDFRGQISRFLTAEDGRAYVARVPGISQSLLNDAERAAVLNWIATTFDPAHLPASFVPFTADEIARWRHDALSNPTQQRARLLSGEPTNPPEAGGANGTPVPAAYAPCAACHTVGADGTHGIGPNLRGVVGRKAGTASQFFYSPSLRKAGITWSSAELDAFLKAPASHIPGNFMSYPGIADESARRQIIEYLSNLN